MMERSFSESIVEEVAMSVLADLGFASASGALAELDVVQSDRRNFAESFLARRLRDALAGLNPEVTPDVVEEAFRRLTLLREPSLIANNQSFHRLLVNGIAVETRREDGSIGAEIVRLIDFEDPKANDWLAVNQFTVVEGQHIRRPDIVLFVNGLPLAVMELKNAADENADIWSAFRQIQTYKAQIPSLLAYNAVLVISDGLEARIGTISADSERFMPWRTIGGETIAPATIPQLEVLIRGVFDQRRFLNLVRHFLVFEDDGSTVTKKMAGYHQFHAVNTAVEETLRATGIQEKAHIAEPHGGYFARSMPGGEEGDRRVGVVWHTQGSGKSLSMAFYAGRLVLEPTMENPTIVVITDRNDLDDQLFGTFSRCHELLRQKPVQAESRDHLRELLQRASGGVIFTTVQKFFPGERGATHPLLSDRRNIVVIADEAHRSQYDFIDGFARHMRDALPRAAFIGFTGTPIEKTDANTRAVFGDYISIYDIQRAVEDKATVPIYYESRLAKLELDPKERPKIDPDFAEATEGEEVEGKERLKTKWAALEAVVGAENRIALIADDLVKHWEARLEAMDGKAMIVCMSRRVCVELYNAIAKLKPEWTHEDDDKGLMKIVMTGSAADGPDWQQHIRTKYRREELANRFKDPRDHFKIVIVRDMWLTGFDAPALHTMYVDKPMRSHGLMQAIARVNRVFKDKPGGLVVDYLGLAHELKQALAVYTESKGTGKPTIDQEEAVVAMLAKYEICRDFFFGFDWGKWTTGTPAEKLALLPAAQEHILRPTNSDKPEEKKQRFLQAVTDLSKAFALAVPHEKALAIRDDVGFFQAVRAALAKNTPDRRRSPEETDAAIRQIISRAVASDKVVDVFAAAGLKRPDISILSDQFLSEVRGLPQKNLAVELLRKLLTNEIKTRGRKNLVQSRSFAKLLENSIRKYQNRGIEAAQVIEELIGIAKEMREGEQRGEKLGLTEEEAAFYDALGTNDSAVQALGDENLRFIAQELTKTIRENITIDWTEREAVRARLRVMVKRILRKYGYPPDKQEQATKTVLEQAEVLCAEWAE
jgi:type I restriction enzyme R subunit